MLNTNNRTPLNALPPEPIKPWLPLHNDADPIIRFRADDRKWYAAQSHELSAVYDELAQRLEVKAPPHGTIVITGPKAENLFELLCAHKATAIRTDKAGILSVEVIPDEEDEEEAQAVADAVLQG